MTDIELIRANPEVVKKDLEKRGMKELVKSVDEIKKKDERWRKLKVELDALRAERNTISKQINEAKKSGGDVKKFLARAKKLPHEIREFEEEEGHLRKELDELMLKLPNILDKSVPVGKDAGENAVIRKFGKAEKKAFKLLSHVELCEALGLADFERSAKIAGRGFYFLKNELVLLENALVRFVLDKMHKKGFTLMQVPFMMRRKAYEGVTDLSAFEDALYKIENEDEYLIATSEHPLVAQFMNEILEEKELPIRLAGVSSCFRKEAGAHGVDEKGLFRVHQFNKVEQVVLCKAEDSAKWHEELLKNAEEIFNELELPYRVVLLCSADTGKVMAKTYDIQVWMPRTQEYKEAVSCSNATDYQARRLGIRFRTSEGMKLVHTLNSTAIATSRAIVAILENFQQKDGSVAVPKVLWPYMNGIKAIKKG